MKTKALHRTPCKSAGFTNIFTALVLFFACLLHLPAPAQVLEQDSLALVAFYNSTGGPNWNNNANWLTGPVSAWYGVTVGGGRVIELKVYSNNLIGTLPNEIGELKSLYKITLSNNQGLTGNIPETIFSIDSLIWLAIGNCSITGTIPNCIGNCSCLESISFRENNLSGSIPPEIGNLINLQFLYLFSNQLTGSIPTELGNCTKLWELRLNNNQLIGELPPELENLNELYHLDVSNNYFEGDIPDEFANIITCESMFFHNNQFTGIPPWDNNWFLSALWIQNNKMTFEDIEPHFVGYMWFNYFPQDSIGIKIDTVLTPGSNYGIYSGTGGEYTEYHWYRNGELLLQSNEADTLWINNFSNADTGTYQCWAENSLATELTLVSRPVHVKIDTGVNILHAKYKDISIYPIPANDRITVEMYLKDRSTSVQIINMQGKCVLKKDYEKENCSRIVLDIKHLSPGMYLFNLQTKIDTYSTKFIKSKRGTNR